MTPIPAELREKWIKEANDHADYRRLSQFDRTVAIVWEDGYTTACEARHREYQERVATLEDKIWELIEYNQEGDEFDNDLEVKYYELLAIISPPPAKQQEL